MHAVMIDNCILSLSDTMQCILKPVEVRFGDFSQWVDVIGFERRPVPGDDEQWKLEQFNCLPTIARLACEGQVVCYTYSELRHEAWRRPRSFPGDPIGRLFIDVGLIDVDAAVERSYFFQGDIADVVSHEKMVEFCKWLLNVNVEIHVDRLRDTGRFPDYLIENLRRIGRFRELCAGLADSQIVDAFHLWTAETNGVEYFLTTDRKFINVMTKSKSIELLCRPIAPVKLLEIAGVSDRDSFPHPETGTIDIFGNPL